MFLPPLSKTLLLLVVSQTLPSYYTAAANPILPNNNDDDGTLLLDPPGPAPVLNQNGSVMVKDDELQLQCRGGQFGDQLDYTACRDALRTFTKGDSPLAVEVGRRGMGGYGVGLPWKWVSGKDLVLKAVDIVNLVLIMVFFHKGNGRCTFDIVLRGPGPSDTTTGLALAGAAVRLLDECVRDGGGKGGIVSGLGASSPSLSPFHLFIPHPPIPPSPPAFFLHLPAIDSCLQNLQSIMIF